MKAFALIRMNGGQPDIPAALAEADEPFNFVLCDRIGGTGWGAYLCCARGIVLQQLDESYGGFIGIVAVTESGDVRWGELDNPCADTVRTRLNIWLENHGHPTIPESWSNRRVVREIFRRANQRFDISGINIMDVQ